MSENRTELMMYQTEDGQTKIDVRMENETVWLSLDQMAELFQRDKSTISRHIRNIFAEGELDREAVTEIVLGCKVPYPKQRKRTFCIDPISPRIGSDFPWQVFPP